MARTPKVPTAPKAPKPPKTWRSAAVKTEPKRKTKAKAVDSAKPKKSKAREASVSAPKEPRAFKKGKTPTEKRNPFDLAPGEKLLPEPNPIPTVRTRDDELTREVERFAKRHGMDRLLMFCYVNGRAVTVAYGKSPYAVSQMKALEEIVMLGVKAAERIKEIERVDPQAAKEAYQTPELVTHGKTKPVGAKFGRNAEQQAGVVEKVTKRVKRMIKGEG